MLTKGVKELAIEQARRSGRKLEICPKVPTETKADSRIAYMPGIAAAFSVIHERKGRTYELTTKKDTVVAVSDGSAALGSGSIGPEAATPVMEEKAALFKRSAGVDLIPLVLDTQDTGEVIQTVKFLALAFRGINLEDVSIPRCFEIEQCLIDELDIPVFHGDQRGTVIVVLTALYNSLKLINKRIEGIHAVINGGGSAGPSTTREFLVAGVEHVIITDRIGILSEANTIPSPYHVEIAKLTNRGRRTDDSATVLEGADILVGVSVPSVLKPQWT